MNHYRKTVEATYDEISKTYEEKYVSGGLKNPYMVDEAYAAMWWTWSGFDGDIVSLGVGSGQDIDILGYPDPSRFTGYDISTGMLANARRKFPGYADCLVQYDCRQTLPENAKGDVLVSMFGAPNYLGTDQLIRHYDSLGCSGAFFVFYNEYYDDGVMIDANHYTKRDLIEIFDPFFPYLNVADLFPGSNYYVVTWNENRYLQSTTT